MVFTPNAPAVPLLLQASTGLAGFALQNGTPNILTWTAPNDGQMHRVQVVAQLHVTVAETGGQVNFSGTWPDASGFSFIVETAGQGAGSFRCQYTDMLVAPNTTVTLAQTSALTAGTALLWAQIWGI